MRTNSLLGACRRLTWWQVSAVAVMAGVMTAAAGMPSAIASQVVAPNSQLPPGMHGVPRPGVGLAQAPAGLRAAVRQTLGRSADAAARVSKRVKLTARNGAADDDFGISVAISGATAVVGANRKNSQTGAAYVFVRSGKTWSQQAELTAHGGAKSDEFGYSVAISGSTAIVGAFERGSGTGAAYVFTRSADTWSEQAELTAAGSAPNSQFGWSVAVSGSTAVVGANIMSNYTGAAYVFVRSGKTWSQQAKLTAHGVAAGDFFGTAVAVSGSTAVVSTENRKNTGAAYLFVRSGKTWSQQAKLADHATSDDFGVSVGISGSTAVVGADSTKSDTGAAYVFVRSRKTWSQQAKLTGSVAGDYFGAAVAVSGSTAVVSAQTSGYLGKAYVFVRSGKTWSQQAKLTVGNCAFISVAVSGSTAIVGDASSVGLTPVPGAAYVFGNI